MTRCYWPPQEDIGISNCQTALKLDGATDIFEPCMYNTFRHVMIGECQTGVHVNCALLYLFVPLSPFPACPSYLAAFRPFALALVGPDVFSPAADTIVASFYNFIMGNVEVGFAVMGSNSVNIFAPSIEGFGTAVGKGPQQQA